MNSYSKIKRAVLVIIPILLLLLTVYLTGAKNLSKADDAYATDWAIAEGNGFTVISGNISNNLPGAKTKVKSGETSVFYISFGTRPTDTNGPNEIEPGKFGLRITLPGNFNSTLNTPLNINYNTGYGTETDPNGTPISGASKKYYWITNATPLQLSQLVTMNFTLTPFANGITNDGANLDFSVAMINLNNNKNISGENTNGFIAITDSFRWYNVEASVSYTPTVSIGRSTGDTLNNAKAISGYNQLITTVLKRVETPNGSAFAKSLTFENEFELPLDPIDGTPLIKIDSTNLFESDGVTPIDSSVVTFKKDSNNRIIGFTIKKTINTSDNTNELTPLSYQFRVKEPKIDETAPTLAGLTANQSYDFYIKKVADNNYVEPLVTLNSSYTSLDANGKLKVAQQYFNSNSKNTIGDFKYTVKKSEEDLDSYLLPLKNVIKTGGDTVTNQTQKKNVFPGEEVQYELGAERITNKNTSNITLKYTEEAGVDYDANYLNLKSIVWPKVYAEKKITVTYSDGDVRTVTSGANNYNGAISLPSKPSNVTIKKIEGEVTLVPGAKIDQGFITVFEVKDQNNLMLDDHKLTNTVHSEYIINSTSKKEDAKAEVFYRLKPTSGANLVSHDKTGEFLAGSAVGDVIQFKIILANYLGSDEKIDQIIDNYTANSLDLYNGTTINSISDPSNPAYGLIDSRYLNSSNQINLVLWDQDPSDPASTPLATWPGSTAPTITTSTIGSTNGSANGGVIDIKFASDLIIPAGKTYYLTYTLKIRTANAWFANQYEAYDNGKEVGDGFWGALGDGTSGSYVFNFKYHSNISIPNNPKPWTIRPYGGDVIMYTSEIVNNTNFTWDGSVSPIIYTDTYSSNLIPYDKDTGFNTACTACPFLDLTKPLNLGVVVTPGVDVANQITNNPDKSYTTQTGFDASKISITTDDSNHKFSVNLGANKIEPGKKVVLVYTMQVDGNVKSNDKLTNKGDTTYNGKDVSSINSMWKVNANQHINGEVALKKGFLSATSPSGTSHGVGQVENGDTVKYAITASNIHVKANQFIKVQDIIDKIPDYMEYKPNSVSIKFFKEENNTKTEQTLSADASNFTVTYVNKELKIKWNNALTLTAAEYQASDYSKTIVYSYEITYETIVNTAGLPQNYQSYQVTNNASLFIINPKDELANSNNDVKEDTNNLDGEASSKTYITKSAPVTILNNNYYYGTISKTALNSHPIGAQFNVLTATKDGRTWRINIANTGQLDWTISRFTDVLPEYETLKAGTLKVDGNVINTYVTSNDYNSSKFIGVKQQRLIATQDIVIPVGKTVVVEYETVVDKDAAYNKLVETNNHKLIATDNKFSIYTKGNIDLTLNYSYLVNKVDDSQENIDKDSSTNLRYEVVGGAEYWLDIISPAVTAEAKVIYSDGTTGNYVQNVTAVNPGEGVVWAFGYGNNNNAINVLKARTKLVVVLPDGVKWNGEYYGSNAVQGLPSHLTHISTTPGPSNSTVIVWELKDNINPGGYNYDLRIKTETENYKFTSYSVHAYLIPNRDDKAQVFYDNDVINGNLTQSFKGMPDRRDISSIVASLTGNTHFVVHSAYVDVYGTYGMSSYKAITYKGQTITSRSANTTMSLDKRDDTFKYSLRIESVKDTTVLSEMVFIDRLPSIGDKNIISDYNRNSEANVRLEGDGNFEIKIKADKNSAVEIVDPAKYEVEYFFGSPSDKFNDDDKKGVANTSRWFSKAYVSNPTNNKKFREATAFRIRFTDPSVKVGSLGTIDINYDARLGLTSNSSDYKIANAIALNNFGYKVEFGVAGLNIISEVIAVGVKADIPASEVTINKVVDLDGHTDAASRANFEKNAKNKVFTFELVGKDNNNAIKYNSTQVINVTWDATKQQYLGSIKVSNLNNELTYEVREVENKNFSTAIVPNKTTDAAGKTEYIFDVTNTWKPIKLEAQKIWQDVSGSVISPSDINKLLGSIVTSNINISLYEGTSVNIDSMQSVTGGTAIASKPINLTTLNVDFGYYNIYDENNVKYTYKMAEANALIVAGKFVANSTGLVEQVNTSGSFGKTTFTNRLVGGNMEITKKDDLGRILPGVSFTIYDPYGVGTVYDTDAHTGKITLSNINPGEYIIHENQPPFGYIIPGGDEKITIPSGDTSIQRKDIINYIIRGGVELTKTDNLSPANPLANVSFQLFDSQNSSHGVYTTGADGKIKIGNILAPGNYYFKEVAAPSGYVMNSGNDHISFIIPLNPNPSKPTIVTVVNDIIKGSVELTKTDDLSPASSLANAEFELYKADGTKISTHTTNSSGKISVNNLNPGSYYFTETKAPDGYVKQSTNVNFTIPLDPKATVQVSAVNKIIRGEVELIKKDDLNNVLANAEFELYKADGTKISTHTSDTNGKISVDNLVPGDYYFTETKAPAGYDKQSANINFTIPLDPKATVQVSAINNIIRGEVELTKKDDLNNVLANAEFELYKADGTKISTHTSDANGKINVQNLVPGNYYFTETKAPVGYVLQSANINFTIVHNPKAIVNVEAINNIIRGSVEFTKYSDLTPITYLKDAEVDLFDSNNNKIGSYVTDVNGKIVVDNLVPGNYYFVETKAPFGYELNSKHVNFTIAHNPTTVESVELENKIITASAQLTLWDHEDNLLSGGVYALYDANDNIMDKYVTDNEGTFIVSELKPGEYYFKQLEAPTGYLAQFDEAYQKHYFEIKMSATKTKMIKAKAGVLAKAGEIKETGYVKGIVFGDALNIASLHSFNFVKIIHNPDVNKQVSGTNVPSDKYSFTLTALNKAPMPADSVDGTKLVVASKGAIDFGEIHYTLPGTYEYLVKEVNTKLTGYTYDTNVYKKIVNVSFDGRRLSKAITYELSGKATANNNIVFINKYASPTIVNTGNNNMVYALVSLIVSILGVSAYAYNRKR